MSFSAHQNYRVSGAEWPDKVPSHWAADRLKRRVTLVTRKAEAADNPVALEHIESWSGRLIETESEFEAGGIAFKAGDVLFGKLRPYLAKAHVAELAGEAVGDFHVLRPSAGTESRFLGYHLLTREVISMLDGSTYGSKMPRVGWDFMGSLVLPFPPSHEQRAIFSFLDRETAKIDALIEEQQRLIALLDEKRQAVISQAVTKGLDPDVPMKDSGIDWLREVPAHWEEVPLRSLAAEGLGTFTDGDWIESPYITDDGIRLIQTGNVGVGRYKEQGFRFISDETFSQLRCSEVLPGDVLICRLAEPVGRACIAPDLGVQMITSVDVCILRPRAGVSAEYLNLLFSSKQYLGHMEGQCRGGTRDRVSRSFLGRVRVPLPPPDEQHRIADVVLLEVAQMERLRAEACRAVELLQERRAALISAAVTGKIDVRGLVEGQAEAA